MKHETPDIEGSRLAPPNLTRQHRYEWLKRMWAEPKSVLTSDTKLVLGVIWEAVDKETQSVVRHYDTLAKASGLTAEGVRGCCSRAVAAGYLRRVGKGGVVYDDQGNRRGIPSRFTLLDIHGLASTGKDASRVEEGGKPGWEPQQGVSGTPTRRAGQPDNTPSLPLSSPCMSPEGVSGLPMASHKDRFGWEGFWIDVPAIVARPSDPSVSSDFVIARIQDLSLAVLGWRSGDRRDVWQTLSAQIASIDSDVMSALVERYLDGSLTDLDLTNVLAWSGITPPRAAVEEETNAA